MDGEETNLEKYVIPHPSLLMCHGITLNFITLVLRKIQHVKKCGEEGIVIIIIHFLEDLNFPLQNLLSSLSFKTMTEASEVFRY